MFITHREHIFSTEFVIFLNRDLHLIMQMSNIYSSATALRDHPEFGSSDIPVQPDDSAIRISSSSSCECSFFSSAAASRCPVADFIGENKFCIDYPDNKTENYFDSTRWIAVLPENHFHAMTRKVLPCHDSASI